MYQRNNPTTPAILNTSSRSPPTPLTIDELHRAERETMGGDRPNGV
jgi:hypothetical protein